LKLPANQRSNDEADVVDSRFTPKMLEWLGFDTGDIVYNQPTPGAPQNKPDFVVKMSGSTAFIVEDKSTDETLNAKWIEQLRRYTVGTSGYCLWTNGRSVTGLRFDANGNHQVLVEVRVDSVFGETGLTVNQEANFEILHLLYHKDRFTNIATYIREIAIDEDEWKKQVKTLTDEDSLRTFIAESRFVLEQLTTAIKARLNNVSHELDEATRDRATSQAKYLSIVTDLFNRLKGGGGVNLNELTKLEEELKGFAASLSDVDTSYIERARPAMSTATIPLWENAVQQMKVVISSLRERELARTESRRIRDAYLLWLERYKFIEGEERGSDPAVEARRQQAFAEQVSYVFFVRLLLVRVLEDKGIMARIVSDGGFKNWFAFLESSSLEDRVHEIRGEAFLPLVYNRVVSFYRHFFQQPVFDWFQPDDYLLALVLHRLNMYNFKDVSNDLLGFTYEAFIDRTARNQKGHFLTPPAIVDFMLDRTGYNTPAIIGESLLDPACGSGSFLVHAARRLREVCQSTMADRDALERARFFIEQVKTRVVGLEINPFSCYLAELNLFIQVLDDLALLWKHNERPDIERFAIYNTNSLEMPRAILSSEQQTRAISLMDDATALDDAAEIKSKPESFGYILCNPPYVNRGIILEAKRYGEYPFYREVVKGDENFYLLFLRLATYYIAPGGSICFICPLNLFGDESTMRAREMFNKWTIPSITRFYVRDVLFPGVLQGVCVVRFDALPATPNALVEVRGGYTIEEATQSAAQVQQSRITNNFPTKTTWNKPWLVNTNLATYDLWQFVRNETSQDLADLISGKMKAQEGDARSTWAKPMVISGPGPNSVPLTKGKNIVDWGSWSAVSFLDPFTVIPITAKDYTSCLWVQKLVQRVASLSQKETVLFLKEVSGLEMKRPIRGTVIQRDAKHPVVADHTVLVMYTLDPTYEDLAYAVFGLITSQVYNFFFSLFSTNAHANFKEILRLPVPQWSAEREKQLAEQTRQALHAYSALYTHEQQYGVQQDAHVSPNETLAFTHLPTLKLEELVLRGEASMNGAPHYSLDVLLNRGLLTLSPGLSDTAREAIELLLRANGSMSYLKGGKDILMPNPKVAPLFLQRLHEAEQARSMLLQQVTSAQNVLDNLVVDAYAITTPAWKEAIARGVPWARN
jgi:type I restriction-modification system DNA methylase subunit